jgi:hypothetical protein
MMSPELATASLITENAAFANANSASIDHSLHLFNGHELTGTRALTHIGHEHSVHISFVAESSFLPNASTNTYSRLSLMSFVFSQAKHVLIRVPITAVDVIILVLPKY